MQTARKNPLTAHLLTAGFAAGSDARIAKSVGAETRARNGAIKRATRPVVSEVNFEEVELPAEFVAAGLAKLEFLLKIGQWDAMLDLIERLRMEHELLQEESRKPRPSAGQMLARHVTELGLPVRTTNLIESVEAFTVGALLDVFPEAFIDLPNCGAATIREIAKALVQAGALTTKQATARVAQWDRGEYHRPPEETTIDQRTELTQPR